ncbi:hypothetical protein F5J12DRAFT_840846 [Pisolithus orientalis]|uniref:uncharacterized protein n=1 Tax=Pisolithus orientalis TaxID=936130 RepID=UPI0022255E84|nr:uncharacterized protein F5J12DRAFT_840846 [Pisolithus orientalis]KAI6002401.1 hypothetical protein F5J12DRAFT_840846 [Pisolithus orientalis]
MDQSDVTAAKTPLVDVLLSHLPSEFSALGCLSTVSSRRDVETLLSFALGGDCSATVSPETRKHWIQQQPEAIRAIQCIRGLDSKACKRPLEDGSADVMQSSKRLRTEQVEEEGEEEDDPPLFTLPTISTTSPVRKKVDITVHSQSIRFVNPSSRVLEASIPLMSITRAFLLPTRGKAKDHWTVVLLCSDVPPDKGKAGAPAQQQAKQNQQVIFGLDALSTAQFATTSYSFFTKANGHSVASSRSMTTTTDTVEKGSETCSSLRKLLSFLSVPFLEPSASIFKSACAPTKAGNSAAGIDAYLSAKQGTLWFFDCGILWGESKPCEFWAVEDLTIRNGVKLLSATGRTCSVILRRRRTGVTKESGNSSDEEEFSETEFAMIDGKEQDPISAWVKEREAIFGRPSGSAPDETSVRKGENRSQKNAVASTSVNGPAWDDSDSDDEDFCSDSPDSASGGSTPSDNSNDEQPDGNASDENEESGYDDDDDDDDEQEEADEELDVARHPLLRPGAMPKMSKSAVNAVVDMVNEEFGFAGDSEEDELQDD